MQPALLKALGFDDWRRNPEQVPSWVGRFIRDYGTRIKALTGADLTKVSMLGAGSYGVAFPAKRKDNVIKVTSDPSEGPLSQLVIDLRSKGAKSLDGIVEFYGVWQGPNVLVLGVEGPSFVIEKEAVIPLARDDIKAMDTMSPTRQALDAMEQTIHDAMAAERHIKARDWRGAREALKVYREHAADAATFFPHIAKSMNALLDNKVLFADGHWGNIGRTIKPVRSRKKDDFALLEIGASKSYGPQVKVRERL